MIPQYEPWIDRQSLAIDLKTYVEGDGFFTEYKKTEEFEKKLADFFGTEYCVVVNNGTISLSLALLAYGVKPGHWVIVPNLTMIATYSAAQFIGANVMLCDVDSNGCLDLKMAREFIEQFPTLIKAVIYVTLNGRIHDWEELHKFYDFCLDHKVQVLEDNAQSMGSCDNHNSRISAWLSMIGSFSFSMPKIITTGQGGCLVTDSVGHYQCLKRLKDFGREKGGLDIHTTFGINAKFTEMQAIMGLNQMENIEDRITNKKRIYRQYFYELENLINSGNVYMRLMSSCETPWFVDLYTDKVDQLKSFLEAAGIGSRRIYPTLESQKCVSKIGRIKDMPKSESLSRTGLWLPSSINISNSTIAHVCYKIKEFFNGK